MARQTKVEKAIEAQTEACFKRVANGVQIPIMNLGKVLGEIRQAIRQGKDADAAGIGAIQKWTVA